MAENAEQMLRYSFSNMKGKYIEKDDSHFSPI